MNKWIWTFPSTDPEERPGRLDYYFLALEVDGESRARRVAEEILAYLCKSIVDRTVFLDETIQSWLQTTHSCNDLYDAILRRPLAFEVAQQHTWCDKPAVTAYLFTTASRTSSLPLRTNRLTDEDRELIALLVQHGFFLTQTAGGSLASTMRYTAFLYNDVFETHIEVREVFARRLSWILILEGVVRYNLHASMLLIESSVRHVQRLCTRGDVRTIHFCQAVLRRLCTIICPETGVGLTEEAVCVLADMIMPSFQEYANRHLPATFSLDDEEEEEE